MKLLSKPFTLLLIGMFIGCQSEIHVDHIIEIQKLKDIFTLEAVDILGEIESQETITGYPCENSQCIKAIFQQGKYEIIFKEGITNRITIYDVPNMANNDNAIVSLGDVFKFYNF